MDVRDLAEQDVSRADESVGLGPLLNQILAPLASLKLTVALFAMSIFIILTGTLAQVDKDIWQVIDEYFRTAFAWIEFQLFLPPSFYKALFDASPPQVPGGFWFPGGWLIGMVMAFNLLAAHLVRFKVQATGWRLISGLLTILGGMVLTSLVVLGGSSPGGIQGQALIPYSVLWASFLAGLAALCAATAYGWWSVPAEQKLTRWLLFAGVLGQAILLGYLLSQGTSGRLSDSAMRILWQLTQGSVAGIVLLVGCILVFKKRGGIVLMHSGIGLMMFGELLVGLTAVEGQMQMQEGETVNFVQDIRTVELAVVDHADAKQDHVTVIPKSLLVKAAKSEQPLTHPSLPFRVKVDAFYQNADYRKLKPGETNQATDGVGKDWLAEERRPGSGTDMDSKVDLSAAYVTLLPKEGDKPLGKYLLGLFFSAQNHAEPVTVDGKTYDLSLRFQRHYKPYRFQLVDVRKDDYIGTDTPRNYSSDVRLVDESRNVDRELRIWMNNPLRFAGETFYQSGYHQDPQTKIEGTTLQVVTNTGWMIPYVSCMLVAVGLLAHFSMTLWRFLQRTETSLAATAQQTPAERSTTARIREWGVPIAAMMVVSAIIGIAAVVPRADKDQFDYYAFGKLPIVADGRAKPIDTLARNTLLGISSKQTYTDADGDTQPAVRWLLDVVAKPQKAFEHRVFRIESLDVQKLVGLERRERFRYAPSEFLTKINELSKQADQARERTPAEVSVYDKKVLELEKKLGMLDTLMQSFAPPDIRPEHAQQDLMEAMSRQKALLRRHPPLAIPPTEKDAEWDTFATAWTKNLIKTTYLNQKPDEPTEAMTRILVAYASDEPETFNQEVAQYAAWLKEHAPPELQASRTSFEAFFNHVQPFGLAQYLYLLPFLCTVIAWLGWSRTLNRTAMGLLLLTFALHTFALVARIVISGRPPVTNLYSSAVFIGWGCVLLGLLINLFYRNGIGTVVSTVAGFATLGIAHHLSTDGDTFSVLQAVLDTQFWLATHVVCITFGYATTYLAGLLGLVYVLVSLAPPDWSTQLRKELYRMIYGVLCFSIFFSFVGTVLGGLWADDSWGRFWGWDPKENGALMIVLWNALCLHARWGAMVKERGLALLAIAGNIVVSWSWFGVNELGVGLHAYGFREGMVFWLTMFALSQVVMIAVGLIPMRSFWGETKTARV